MKFRNILQEAISDLSEELRFGSKERIHVSKEPIGDLTPIEQTPGSLKPRGLWYGFGDEWIGWLKMEMPEWWGETQYAYKIFPDTSNILVINTREELDDFIKNYYGEKSIDWVKVAQVYDGFEIPHYRKEGFRQIVFTSPEREKYMWVYAMDISSGCIWNPKAIKTIKPFGKKSRAQGA